MAKGDEFRRIEEAGASLDRMKAPKYLVEQATVVRATLKINQLVIDVGQQITGLLQKIVQEIFHSGEITHRSILLPVAGDFRFGFRIPGYPAGHRPAAGQQQHRAFHRR